ncbi:hypothetical protein BJV78DRAFT_1226924 [Lactifluus subvellereus]|nr:hypothetical protein BJV78DRAFT_1226924 [Lactifluus subvellereus]
MSPTMMWAPSCLTARIHATTLESGSCGPTKSAFKFVPAREGPRSDPRATTICVISRSISMLGEGRASWSLLSQLWLTKKTPGAILRGKVAAGDRGTLGNDLRFTARERCRVCRGVCMAALEWCEEGEEDAKKSVF